MTDLPVFSGTFDGTELIEMLIETRAKGGNLLLNVGPEPSGVIPFEQERIIRELGLWIFINHEASQDGTSVFARIGKTFVVE